MSNIDLVYYFRLEEIINILVFKYKYICNKQPYLKFMENCDIKNFFDLYHDKMDKKSFKDKLMKNLVFFYNDFIDIFNIDLKKYKKHDLMDENYYPII